MHIILLCVTSRFRDSANEPTLDYDVVLHLDDNTQLPVERYRDRLSASIAGKRERMRMRQEEQREEPDDVATPTPAEATPTSERAKSARITPKQPKHV